MKKFLLIIAACFVLASCSQTKNQNPVSEPETKITVTQTAYKEENIETPDDMSTMCRLGYSDNVKLIYENKNNTYMLADYNSDMQIVSTTPLFSEKNIWNIRFFISDKGKISAFIVYLESDADIQDENYFDSANISFELRTFSAEGVPENVISLDEISNYYDVGNEFIENFSELNGGYLIQTNNSLITLNDTGIIQDVQNTGDKRICYGADNHGDIVCASHNGYTYMNKISLPADDNLTPYGKYLSLSQGVATGHGGFKIFFMLNNGIYGLTETDEIIQIVDYNSSLVTVSDYYEICYAGEGKFIGICADENTGIHLSTLTVRPDDYKMNRQKVILGVNNTEGDIQTLATMYNKKSDSYQVEIKTYNDFDSIKLSVLSGESPDMYMSEPFDIKRLVNLGAVADMYELSAQYGGFTKDDILDNIIKAYEYKGGLYMMSQSFGIRYMAGLKENFPDGHMTYQEFFNLINNAPEGVYLGGNLNCRSREYLFDDYCIYNLSNWIDFDNAECFFDTPDFVQLLEFIDNAPIPPEIDWQALNEEEEKGNMTYDEYHSIWLEETMRVKNGTALTFRDYFTRISDIDNMKQLYGVTPEEVTYIYPFNNSEGEIMPYDCYSILSTGNCTIGAWDYMNFLMSDDLLTNYLQTKSAFVTRKESLHKNIKKTQELSINPEVKNADGTITHYGYAQEPITDENINALLDYIDTCTAVWGSYPEISDIAKEEYLRYTSGEITAEKCGETIQSRVSLYLSEIN